MDDTKDIDNNLFSGNDSTVFLRNTRLLSQEVNRSINKYIRDGSNITNTKCIIDIII